MSGLGIEKEGAAQPAPPLSAADMLTQLHDCGLSEGATFNDEKDGWFGWVIQDAGTGEGVLTCKWTANDGFDTEQSMSWDVTVRAPDVPAPG
jgi:hypothetical protein